MHAWNATFESEHLPKREKISLKASTKFELKCGDGMDTEIDSPEMLQALAVLKLLHVKGKA